MKTISNRDGIVTTSIDGKITERGIEVKTVIPLTTIEGILCALHDDYYDIAQIVPGSGDFKGDLNYKWVNAALSTNGCVSFKLCEGYREDGVEIQHSLHLKSIAAALALIHNKWPHHYKDILSENGDVITASVLVQVAIFGDIVYG